MQMMLIHSSAWFENINASMRYSIEIVAVNECFTEHINANNIAAVQISSLIVTLDEFANAVIVEAG